jgi:hypothetical protein
VAAAAGAGERAALNQAVPSRKIMWQAIGILVERAARNE